jgi:hypothetical protein
MYSMLPNKPVCILIIDTDNPAATASTDNTIVRATDTVMLTQAAGDMGSAVNEARGLARAMLNHDGQWQSSSAQTDE